MTDIDTILDRCHAINQTIAGVNAERYFTPKSTKPDNFPYLIPLDLTETRNNARTALSQGLIQYQIELFAGVGFIMEAIAGKSVQETGEQIKIAVRDKYLPRPRLQLNDNGLAGVKSADYIGYRSTPLNPDNTLLSIRFQFTVTIQIESEVIYG